MIQNGERRKYNKNKYDSYLLKKVVPTVKTISLIGNDHRKVIQVHQRHVVSNQISEM